MDVVSMSRCLLALGELGQQTPPADYMNEPVNRDRFYELKIISRVFKIMASIVIGTEKGYTIETENNLDNNHISISQLLVLCSELAHLLFVIYRASKGRFLPPQNYRNWQDTIKSFYISVSVHKHYGVNEYWYFLDSTQKLEEFFGIIRCMYGGDTNFDALQLKRRIGDAITIQKILQDHLEQHPGFKKLNVSYDRKNIFSWKGCTDVRLVNEVGCWNIGSQNAVDILVADGVFTLDECDFNYIATRPNHDLLRPHGHLIGVLSGAEGINNGNEEENDDEEQLNINN